MPNRDKWLSQGAGVALAIVVALILVWRVVVTGSAELLSGSRTGDPAPDVVPLSSGALEAPWRSRLARNPADASALVVLALQLERQGKFAEAGEAMGEALRLAPADKPTLLDAAAFDLRRGDEARALATLARMIDLYPAAGGTVWPAFTALLDSGRHGEFFASAARGNARWWQEFFGYACEKSTAVDSLHSAFAARAAAGTASATEQRCVVERLQRENRWEHAYQAWLNSLPREQRQRVGYVYNGNFEAPITHLGFDWVVSKQDGVAVEAQATEGAGGRRALHVEFVGKRWGGPPVRQYLLLFPGRYRFEGRSRSDGLDTWLGVQWGIYCLAGVPDDSRQLVHSDKFRGTSEWSRFDEEFAVPPDCPAQVLRLELANPRADVRAPGNVAIRLRGSLWFDDFRITRLD